MNVYIYEIVLAIGMLFGIILGISCSLFTLSSPKKNPSYKHRLKKQQMLANKEVMKTESVSNNGILKQRLGERESWTEFNCNEDDMNSTDYIRRSRKKEDNAYKIVQRRTKRNKSY